MNNALEYSQAEAQHLFQTLIECLEDGEEIPIQTLSSYLKHPEERIRRVARQLLELATPPSPIVDRIDRATPFRFARPSSARLSRLAAA